MAAVRSVPLPSALEGRRNGAFNCPPEAALQTPLPSSCPPHRARGRTWFTHTLTWEGEGKEAGNSFIIGGRIGRAGGLLILQGARIPSCLTFALFQNDCVSLKDFDEVPTKSRHDNTYGGHIIIPGYHHPHRRHGRHQRLHQYVISRIGGQGETRRAGEQMNQPASAQHHNS